MAFVYILRSGGENLFKIGRTDGDVDARIRQLATGNPHPLTKFDVIQTEHDSLCETYLHRMLRSRKSLASDAREFFDRNILCRYVSHNESCSVWMTSNFVRGCGFPVASWRILASTSPSVLP